MPVKGRSCLLAHGGLRLHHVERVQVGMIDVHLRRDARGAQLREIANSLGVERLAVADERIGGRQAGKVRQPRGRGIGRQDRTVSAAQVEPPCEMVAPGVPDAAMVVAGGLGVAVSSMG